MKLMPVLFVISLHVWKSPEQHVQQHVHCMWLHFNHIFICPFKGSNHKIIDSGSRCLTRGCRVCQAVGKCLMGTATHANYGDTSSVLNKTVSHKSWHLYTELIQAACLLALICSWYRTRPIDARLYMSGFICNLEYSRMVLTTEFFFFDK